MFDPANSVTSKEMIDWIEKEIDRVRACARVDTSASFLSACSAYIDHLKQLNTQIFVHSCSLNPDNTPFNPSQKRSSSPSDKVTPEELSIELQRLQAEIEDSTEPVIQFYRSSLVQLEMDIHNIAKTIAQSKLGEKV
jgi:hypothetical protein